MIPRMTTIGTLKNYRYDLNRSNNTMASSMNKVITQRNFNSYAENPAMATRCFQLRRSFQRTSSQLSVNDSVWHKYDVAWQALGGVTDDLYDIVNETSDSGFKSILTSLNDADASGRNALGQSMAAKAKSIIQTMNGRYGENYVFSGADHLEVPFTWDPMENPDYIQNPDPKNEEHAKAFRYMIDPNSTEAQDGQLYTDDPALAKQVGEPNPRYDEKYTQEVLDAANPDPDPDAMKDPRFGKYLLADGSGTTNTDDPNLVKRVPEENPKYNPNSSFKYLDAKGEGTNFESAAQTVLCYRGVAVNSMSEEDQKKMEYFIKDEHKYVDIGLGFKEKDGEAVSSSVFDAALQGIYFLGGYGTETVEIEIGSGKDIRKQEVEIPNNVVSIIDRMSTILLNCDPDNGRWASEEEREEFRALAHKFEDTISIVQQRWDEQDTESSFLRDNKELLTDTADSLSQQFMAMEDADPAAAISEYMFARYAYDTALKVGNSILSQSLMDYMNL